MKIRTLTAAITLLVAQAAIPANAGQPSSTNFGFGELVSWTRLAQDYLDNTPSLAGNDDSRPVVTPDPNPGTLLEPLSPEEESTLVFMREEEKMARDVYLVLFDQWGVSVFENIALRSEQKHMDTMKDMLDKYGIADPVTDDTVGVFVDADLANLYQDLVERGMVSLEEALMVGALIEEVDILDLMRAIEEASHPDLIEAYENLMRGSRNHLRAFVGQLENLGIVYEAQLMDQELVDEILDSPTERNSNSNGRPWNDTGDDQAVDPSGHTDGDDGDQGSASPSGKNDSSLMFTGFSVDGDSGSSDSGKLCTGIECLF